MRAIDGIPNERGKGFRPSYGTASFTVLFTSPENTKNNPDFRLSSINLPDRESQKSNFQLWFCQNYTAASVMFIGFLQISQPSNS
jgi:hypothetical protein